jgi:hypothetical protein
MSLIRRNYRAAQSKDDGEYYVIVETRPGLTGWSVVATLKDSFSASEALDAINNALDRFIEDNGLGEEKPDET